MIKIEKNVSIPENSKFGAKYPYRQMKVGDSFLYPKGTLPNTARAGAIQMGKRTGWKFIVRMVAQGLRCWRVE